MRRYYVYRWVGLSCNEAKLLGVFETKFPLFEMWDIMMQIFCSDGQGMFVRNELI